MSLLNRKLFFLAFSLAIFPALCAAHLETINVRIEEGKDSAGYLAAPQINLDGGGNLGRQYVIQNFESKSKLSTPNVILIITDDQGYGDIAANGNPYLKTPNLDRLHAESARLTNFHTDPSCSPTRAALMTGQYSARSGVWHTIGGRSLLSRGKTTMADIFTFNGYKTGIFGKWHLGDTYPFRPQDRGFQESVVHAGGVVGSSSDYWGNDYFDDTYLHNGKPEKFEGYCNKVWFDEATSFIKANKEQPFFCFLSTNVPHAPLRVDEKYSAPYRAIPGLSERLANYYGMIAEFDEELGKLLAEIKSLGLEENTIVVFMSDNGPCPWFGGVKINNEGFLQEGYSAGMRGGKIWGYENAHRVPCFIRWPAGGVQKGKDIKNLTAHFDLLPTFIDACKLKNISKEKFDGISLLPLLLDDKIQLPSRTLIVQNQRLDFPVKYKEYQVLTGSWRLINSYQKEMEDMEKFNLGLRDTGKINIVTDPKLFELYDIDKDPEERNNIAANHPDVVKKLSNQYKAWWTNVSKDFDQYNEIVIGSPQENPATLYDHDAHKAGKRSVWAIDVERDGKYQILLALWPKEANKRISENRAGKSVPLHEAHLQVGEMTETEKVNQEDKWISFYVNLKAGPTSLQGWFEGNEKRVNAGYVYVERVSDADPAEFRRYKPSNPDKWLKARVE